MVAGGPTEQWCERPFNLGRTNREAPHPRFGRLRSFEDTEDGQTTKGTMGTMSFDKNGDGTVAIKINIVGAFPIGGDLVFVRQDNVVFLVGHIGMGGIDTDDTETLVSKAERKLSSVL